MSKAIPTTKEQLVYFLHNNVSLGTYDKKFLDNLITLYIVKHLPITSNQSDLLTKIVLRYERQLHKFEVNATEAVNLNWTVPPVPSLPKFTQAHITINENKILLHSPFKSEFVKEFRALKYTEWNRQDKIWYVPYSETTLKGVINSVNKHYTTVNYCDTTTEILNKIKSYSDVKFWNPTLVNVNGRLLIASSNNYINESIKDLELDDSLPTIARLAYRGITIDDSVIDKLSETLSIKKILFAIERHSSLELDPDLIIEYMLSVKTDFVLLPEWSNGIKSIVDNLKNKLEEHNIYCEVTKLRDSSTKRDVRQAELPISISSFSFSTSTVPAAKVITLVNKNQINLNETM